MAVMVPESYKGKKRACAHIRVQVGGDTLATLKPVLEDRPASALLLERWRYTQVKRADRTDAATVWERGERGAWTTASQMTRMWNQACKDAGLPPPPSPMRCATLRSYGACGSGCPSVWSRPSTTRPSR